MKISMDDASESRDHDGMQLEFHTCTLLVGTLALAACGSGPISIGDDSGETGSDDADTGGTDDTGDTGDTDGPEALGCIDDNGLVHGALRLESELDRAWVIDGATEMELELTGPDGAVALAGVAAGDWIAVMRFDGDFSGGIMHAFSRSSGELQWTRELDGFGVSRMWLAEDGWLAASATPYLPGVRVGFVMSEQEMFDLPDHEPIAAPALGHVAAYAIDSMGFRQQVGWMDLDDQGFQPASPTPSEMSAFVSEDQHTLEYLALVDGAPALVRARPGEAETIVLPIEQLDGQSLFVETSTGRYRVVGRYDTNTEEVVHVRVDVEAGEAVLVNPEPPPGWSFFDCYARRIAVDGGGRLYYELRNDASARPWAYDVEQDTWTQLGLELGLVDDIDVMAQSQDVMLVRGMAQFQTFCPPTEWAPAPEDALVGDSQQLIRREPAVSMVLPTYTWQVMIDREQRCAASMGEDGWEVRALDGSDTVIDGGPGSGTWLWLD
jgi:hypothetical protein